MKKIEAIIRKSRFEDVKQALLAADLALNAKRVRNQVYRFRARCCFISLCSSNLISRAERACCQSRARQ